MDVQIENSWKEKLGEILEEQSFKDLHEFVSEEYFEQKVYPAPKNVFEAFTLTPFENVKVVILGQDPYHGESQATGLSFAVPADTKIPPSLQNIFKEIESDLGKSLVHKDGDLSRWAKQGVLLLNATLTVRAGTPGSHQGKGWEEFTDAVVQKLSDEKENLIFILWGNYARTKGARIDRTKHLVLESPHPSPFSAYNGFFGSKPFSKTNAYLEAHGKSPIDWL